MQAQVSDAQVGVEVFDRQTGTVLTSLNSQQQFPSMSVVKLLIALDVLHSDNWALPDGTQQQLSQMLSASDDNVADNLWDADGGGDIVSRMVSLIGLSATQPPPDDDPGEWGSTLTTPQDIVTVYNYITNLPSSDRDFILGALGNAPQYAADGTDQYFGIPDGLSHATWEIKQGWGTSGDQAVINTTGLVGSDARYVVVLLTSASASEYSSLPPAVTAGTNALSGIVS